MVTLDCQQVITPLIGDLLGDVGVGPHGVDGHELTFEVEQFEQPGDGFDFVAFLGDEFLGEGDPALRGPGTHGMDGFASLETIAAAQTFAVERDDLIAKNRLEGPDVCDETLFEEVGIDDLKEVGDGLRAWDSMR